tara:strand:+ start:1063 stop:1521 length:459 start_codon:yes stop_codon:yes gene_type:complete
MLITKYNRYYFILLSWIIFFSDQFTKHIININHKSLINKDFIFFSIDYVKNFGAAFNLFSGSRIFLSIISLIIALILLFIIINKKNISKLDLLSYSFILGGTIGNGYDRIIKGFVIDFINLKFINFPIFNLADVSINIGLLIIIYGLFNNKR